MQVGDSISIRCAVYDQDKTGKYREQKVTLPCSVVFINREHGWFTAEIRLPCGGSYLESFFMGRRAIQN